MFPLKSLSEKREIKNSIRPREAFSEPLTAFLKNIIKKAHRQILSMCFLLIYCTDSQVLYNPPVSPA